MPNSTPEIELKLSCTPVTAAALVDRLTALTGHRPRRQRLENVYYDTPDQRLRAEGIALRIRRDGKRRLQTVKCSGKTAGGLSSRPEWEHPFSGRFEFSAISDAEVRERLAALSAESGFVATLSTNFDRLTWRYANGDAAILIMLDRGEIVAGPRKEALCELELELANGQADALYGLALRIAAEAALFPAPLSKAARGSRLLQSDSSVIESAIPRPNADLTTAAVLHDVLQNTLNCIYGNLPTNSPSFSGEHLHQLRLGLRQLHTLLRVYRPFFRKPWHRLAETGVRFALDTFGAVRDIDVVRRVIVEPAADNADKSALRVLQRSMAATEKKTLDAMRMLLDEPAFGAWLLQLDIALHTWQALRQKNAAKPWGEVSASLLRKRLASYEKHLKNAKPDAQSLHRLRIHSKRVGLMLACAPAEESLLKFQAANEKLRKQLGEFNDIYTGGAVLQKIAAAHPGAIPAIATIGQWHVPRHESLLKSIAQARAKMKDRLRHLEGNLE